MAKYIRLSIDDLKSDSLSIANQHLLLDRHIDSLDIENVEILEFVDNGYSGVNFERPGVQELLDLVRQSKINCIIVKDFSRFGRNVIETGYFIEMVFPLFQTRFISVSDGFDSNDYVEDTGGMEVAFKFLMNDYYSKDLSKKQKTSIESRAKRGEYVSANYPFGYCKGENGRMEIDPEAAETIKMIFELALTMQSVGDIVRALFEKKIPTPAEYRKAKGIGFHDISRSNGIWTNSSVHNILKDEQYTGTYIAGKRTNNEVRGRRILKPESEWIKIPNHHPAIISTEIFIQANAKIKRIKTPIKKPGNHILRSKVVCGCCRHYMQVSRKNVRTLYCPHTKINKDAECHNLEIPEHEIESLLFEIINKQAQYILSVDGLADTAEQPIKIEQQADYERQINIFLEKKQNLYEHYVLGELDAEIYKAEKIVFDAQLSRLNHALNTLKSESAILTAAKASDDELRNLADTTLGADKLTRPLVDLLINKVYVYPDSQIEIDWLVTDYGNNDKACAEKLS